MVIRGSEGAEIINLETQSLPNSKYLTEIKEFHEHFDGLREKKIALYGIGRMTATILENVKDYSFVGLLDKDQNNIGKIYFGIPVISIEEARKQADLIIINTSGTYWNVIYQRIKHVGIPIYFRNGQRAEDKVMPEIQNKYWENTLEELKQKVREAEVVSFDFYDTLFTRKTYCPRDVFLLMEHKIKKEMGRDIPLCEWRSRVLQKLENNYTLKELYFEMKQCFGLDEEIIHKLYYMELKLEKEILIPRKVICECVRYAIASGKDIYIVSDMYLPTDFFKERLKENQIDLNENHIWVSGEKKASKKEGLLWKKFGEEIAKGRYALHIGDDVRGDREMPQKYGIITYPIASVTEMLRCSLLGLGNLESQITKLGTSVAIGTLGGKIFNDPFALGAHMGKIELQSAEDIGYVVYGPVIMAYLMWLTHKVQEEHVGKLVFTARDGYFLKEDYECYCEKKNIRKSCVYIGVSRQLAMLSAIQTEADLLEYIHMPYSGTLKELLEDRFEIKAGDICCMNIEELYQSYRTDMWNYVKKIQKNYKMYLNEMNLDNQCAIADIGYYGNTQFYLNKLLGLHMAGYYFVANLSQENPNTKAAVMSACFQKETDMKAEESAIFQKALFLDSFLTAPYGMVKAVDENGNFICAPAGGNQRAFGTKEEMNRGVKKYISDMAEYSEEIGDEMRRFADTWFDLCTSEAVIYPEEVKKTFYNDNAMMNRIESQLFY